MIQWDIIYLDPEYSVNQMTIWCNFYKFLIIDIFKINVLCKLHASDASFEDMENSVL